MERLVCLLAMTVAVLWPAPELAAQEGEPVIVVAGTGRVEIAPDHATVTFGVSVRDTTPSGALAEMNARLLSVASALAEMDLPWDSLPNQRFSLRPEEDRNQPGRPIIGYTASSSVSAEVRDFDRLPALIERALEAGANTVDGVAFDSDAMERARDEALRRAVAEARRKAEIMAEALDRELGEIIEVSTPEGRRGFQRTGVVVAGSTFQAAITPPTIEVSQTVSVRWRLTPGGR